MDPDATLDTMRTLAAAILRDDAPVRFPHATELAEAVANLDTWLTHGGFLPVAWWVNR